VQSTEWIGVAISTTPQMVMRMAGLFLADPLTTLVLKLFIASKKIPRFKENPGRL
jgi:Co/Zn/Cd efflux system component